MLFKLPDCVFVSVFGKTDRFSMVKQIPLEYRDDIIPWSRYL